MKASKKPSEIKSTNRTAAQILNSSHKGIQKSSSLLRNHRGRPDLTDPTLAMGADRAAQRLYPLNAPRRPAPAIPSHHRRPPPPRRAVAQAAGSEAWASCGGRIWRNSTPGDWIHSSPAVSHFFSGKRATYLGGGAAHGGSRRGEGRVPRSPTLPGCGARDGSEQAVRDFLFPENVRDFFLKKIVSRK
jgi:hypothetical protein